MSDRKIVIDVAAEIDDDGKLTRQFVCNPDCLQDIVFAQGLTRIECPKCKKIWLIQTVPQLIAIG